MQVDERFFYPSLWNFKRNHIPRALQRLPLSLRSKMVIPCEILFQVRFVYFWLNPLLGAMRLSSVLFEHLVDGLNLVVYMSI
jgi:hypothetical protein